MNGKHLIGTPFQIAVNPFTGNCGIKAVDHLSFQDTVLATQLRKEWREKCIEMAESFLYHVCNAGIVLGSDSLGGATLSSIQKYGKDYMFSDKVWNPNYTWAKTHKVQVFSKILVDRKYPDETWRKLPIRFES